MHVFIAVGTVAVADAVFIAVGTVEAVAVAVAVAYGSNHSSNALTMH